MKLSQSILISLSILIGFLPSLSLAMEQALEVAINIPYEPIRGSLVDRLKDKNIELFTSINDPIKSQYCKKILKYMSDKYKKWHKLLISLCICFLPIIIVLIKTDDWNAKGLLLDISFAFLGTTCSLAFLELFLHIFHLNTNRAIANGDLDSVRSCCFYFTSINGLGYFRYRPINCNASRADYVYQPPIIVASANNKTAIVKYLLSQGDCIPDIQAIDLKKNALDSATENNNLEMITALLEHPNFTNFNPDAYVTTAMLKKWPDNIIELLFDKGGRFKIEDFGQVIEQASFEMVKFLVDLGIDVNAKDENGTPAIFAAVMNSKLEVLDLLLANNVDAGIEDAQGNTVSDYLNAQPEIRNAQALKDKLIQFRQRVSDQIYQSLEGYKCEDYPQGFPRDHANLISEYLV
jgi:hypothetical protein